VTYEECIATNDTTEPPSKRLQPEARTRLEDLALLCSNCHRMVHYRRPWLTLEELRQLLSINGFSRQNGAQKGATKKKR